MGGLPSVAATLVWLSAALETSSDDLGIGNRMDFGDPHSTRMDLLLTVKLWELELEIKQKEYQAQLLHCWTVEVEADKGLELRQFSMGEQKPVPLPRKVRLHKQATLPDTKLIPQILLGLGPVLPRVHLPPWIPVSRALM